jgi:hypothetical protein
MTLYIKKAATFFVANNEELDVHQVLPPGNYIVKFNELKNEFYLERIDSFVLSGKLYGRTTRNADRILRTFESRTATTGVMLAGEKGSGKSLLAKKIAVEGAARGYPTIVINAPWVGDAFNAFMQQIEQPAIILFDEFEKVYDSDKQEAILTLLDGVFPSKKLFVLTCNDKWRVDSHMRNRPGRIFYMLDFYGLEADFITEYCEDNLVNKSYIGNIVKVASMFDQFNFDMLKALVEEMNRYNESPEEAMEMLNTKPEFGSGTKYDVKMFVNGVQLPDEKVYDKVWEGNPLINRVSIDYRKEVPVEEDSDGWVHACTVFDTSNIVSVNGETGAFEFKNEGVSLRLSRQAKSAFNIHAF